MKVGGEEDAGQRVAGDVFGRDARRGAGHFEQVHRVLEHADDVFAGDDRRNEYAVGKLRLVRPPVSAKRRRATENVSEERRLGPIRWRRNVRRVANARREDEGAAVEAGRARVILGTDGFEVARRPKRVGERVRRRGKRIAGDVVELVHLDDGEMLDDLLVPLVRLVPEALVRGIEVDHNTRRDDALAPLADAGCVRGIRRGCLGESAMTIAFSREPTAKAQSSPRR